MLLTRKGRAEYTAALDNADVLSDRITRLAITRKGKLVSVQGGKKTISIPFETGPLFITYIFTGSYHGSRTTSWLRKR